MVALQAVPSPLFVILSFCLALASQQQPSPSQNNRSAIQRLPKSAGSGNAAFSKVISTQAKVKIQEELQRNPSSVEGYNLLGIIESDEQDYPNALAAFQNALKLAPNSAKTHNNLGNVYVAQKRLDLAEKEFRTVLRLDPRNRDGNYNLGVLLMAKGSPAEAIPHFERVRPANLATSFNLIHAYFQSKRTAEALAHGNGAFRAEQETMSRCISLLACCLLLKSNTRPPSSNSRRPTRLQPGTFEILYNLGQAFFATANIPRQNSH